MADGQTSTTPSTTSDAPAGGSTTGNNGTAPQSSDKVNIKLSGGGGGFSIDEFNRSLGRETDNLDEPDEPETEDGEGELLDDPEEATTDPRVKDIPAEEGEDESEEEDSEEEEGDESEEDAETSDEELEALGKGVGKRNAIKAFTKDGKAITLPPDLEIEQMVDGKLRKINLREHLNVVAGEMTVEDRLREVTEYRNELEGNRQYLATFQQKMHERFATLADAAAKGRPDLALMFIADVTGMSPVQLIRQHRKIIMAEYEKHKDKTPEQWENHYDKLEIAWREKKERQRLAAEKTQREADAKKTSDDAYTNGVISELKREQISPDEFRAATQELGSKGELQGLSQEARLDRVIEHALLTKHTKMAKSAIKMVNPKLLGNKALFDKLLEATHPNKWTVEEIAGLIREYLGDTTTRIASSLSKKVPPQQVRTKSERQSEAGKKKVYRSQSDLQRAFGL